MRLPIPPPRQVEVTGKKKDIVSAMVKVRKIRREGKELATGG